MEYMQEALENITTVHIGIQVTQLKLTYNHTTFQFTEATSANPTISQPPVGLSKQKVSAHILTFKIQQKKISSSIL